MAARRWTMGRSRCFNFEAKPAPVHEPRAGQAFVTIYENGRIVWQGRDGAVRGGRD
ncbi:MAG: hypothetical protein AB7E05_13085 [Sphingobium sp.]